MEKMKNYYHLCIKCKINPAMNVSGMCPQCRKQDCKECGKKFNPTHTSRRNNAYKDLCAYCSMKAQSRNKRYNSNLAGL